MSKKKAKDARLWAKMHTCWAVLAFGYNVSCCAGLAFGVDAAVLGIHDGTEGARGLNIRLIY